MGLVSFLLLAACRSHDPANGDKETSSIDSADSTTPVDSDTGSCGDVDYGTNVEARAEALTAIIAGTANDCETDWYTEDLVTRSTCEGPWFEETFVSWTPDGETFDVSNAVPIFTSSAVIDAIIGPDGRYYIVYGEGDLQVGIDEAEAHSDWFATHGLSGYGAINGAVSDDGVTFEKLDDFEVQGIVQGMVVDPDVIELPDGRYRMYYVATPVPVLVQPGSWDDGVAHEAFYAESDDLIHWTQIGSAVEGPNADPSVWCREDGYCRMAATGIDWATSEDGGETWTFEYAQDPFGFAPEFEQLDDGRVRLYYNSKVEGGAEESAVSTDGGETFTYEREVVPPNTVEAISLLPAPASVGGYYLYYHFWQSPYNGDYWGEHPCIGQ